jgi:hypothetical protein
MFILTYIYLNIDELVDLQWANSEILNIGVIKPYRKGRIVKW